MVNPGGLEKKYSDGKELTPFEKRLSFRKAVEKAVKVAGCTTTHWMPGEGGIAHHINVLNGCLKVVKRISEFDEPDDIKHAKLKRYIDSIGGFPVPEIKDAIEKLEALKPVAAEATNEKSRRYNASRAQRPPVVSPYALLDDEAALREKVQTSYKLADVAALGKAGEKRDFIDKHRRQLDSCLEMMEEIQGTGNEARLAQFQNILGLTMGQLETAIEKYDRQKENIAYELAVKLQPAAKAKKAKRPAARMQETIQQEVLVAAERGPIMAAKADTRSVPVPAASVNAIPDPAGKPPAVEQPTNPGPAPQPAPAPTIRSMFTRLLRSFGYSANP